MRLLERWLGFVAEAASQPPTQRCESTEAHAISIPYRQWATVLHQRRHPGGVIEASDVRADE
jgi:hypothetical protein